MFNISDDDINLLEREMSLQFDSSRREALKILLMFKHALAEERQH
jgi:hypothetical protein